MENKTKSKDALGITDLIGQITKKQNSGELGKTDKQHVISVNEQKHENTESQKHKNDKTQEHKNSKTKNHINTDAQKREKYIGGRPSMKNPDIEYVRISATIPKALKKKIGNALVDEIFQTENGVIRTVDELVTHAVEKLFLKK